MAGLYASRGVKTAGWSSPTAARGSSGAISNTFPPVTFIPATDRPASTARLKLLFSTCRNTSE